MATIYNSAFTSVANNSLLGYKINFLEEICLEIASNDLEGSIAEVGVYKGGSARLLATAFPSKKVFLFDSFEGMIENDSHNGGAHKSGDFSDTSIEAVKDYLKDKPNCEFFKGWFPQTTANISPFEKFCFVHLDGDYYQTTKSGIDFFWDRLVQNGVIVFDDYEWNSCPGVAQAIEEFFVKSIPYKKVINGNMCAIFKI